MNCVQSKRLLSPYLDGVVIGKQMRAVRDHLAHCQECNDEFQLLAQSQRLLGSLGRKQPPADLALKLRVAISQEVVAGNHRRFAGLWVRLENALNAFMVPATAGAVAAVVVFGLLMGFFALPAQLQASTDDVPLSWVFTTPPELETSAPGWGMGSINADSVVVEAFVNANGRVEDYRILSGPQDAHDLLPQLNNALIFTVFRPATSLGRPTSGRAVLSFSKINVKG
jgi:anti-sigma factor RsiW